VEFTYNLCRPSGISSHIAVQVMKNYAGIVHSFYLHNFANVCRHYEYMKACVFGLPVSTSWKHIRDLVDHRYFYDEYDPTLQEYVGRYTCGMCRNAVAEALLSVTG